MPRAGKERARSFTGDLRKGSGGSISKNDFCEVVEISFPAERVSS
jgi:hypothetical protein